MKTDGFSFDEVHSRGVPPHTDRTLVLTVEKEMLKLNDLVSDAGFKPTVLGPEISIKQGLKDAEECGRVIFDMRDPQPAHYVLLGYAMARGKMLIAIRGENAPQLIHDGVYIVDDIEELKKALAALKR